MRRILAYFGGYWCRMAHAQAMWPVQGYYRCRVCLRTHPVPWEHLKDVQRPRAAGVVSSPALAAPRR